MRQYVYKNRFVYFIITIFDTIIDLTKYILHMKGKDIVSLDNKKRIVMFKLDHIGDVLLAIPSITAIRRCFPKSFITLVVSPCSKELLSEDSEIDEIITYRAYWHDRNPSKRFFHSIIETIRLIQYLRKQEYDLSFDLRGDLFTIIIAFFAGVTYRIGYGWAGGGGLLTHEVETTKEKSQVEILLDAVRALDPPLLTYDSKPKVVVSQRDREWASVFLEDNGFDQHKIMVGIHIGAGCTTKMWLVERYAKLANLLNRKLNCQILFIGGKEDSCLYNQIKNMLEFQPINAINKSNLKESMALIERCSLFIGNDSAPVHISACLDIPTLVIFSRVNSLKRWRPHGQNVEVLSREVPCSNCEKSECDEMICMDIPVDEVFGVANKMVDTSIQYKLREQDKIKIVGHFKNYKYSQSVL